jgi:tetratricopeptide (TPR) repeat protein
VKRATIICIIVLGLAAAAAHAQDLDSLMTTGDKLFEKGDYRSASLYYEEGLSLVMAKAPEESLLIALIHMQMGRCYVMLNNDNTALINYHEALSRAKREIVTDREKAARIIFGAYGSILDIYDRLGLSGPMLDVTDEFIAFIEDYRKSPLPEDVISPAQVDNFLAYCLAQKGDRLTEALTLIESALKTDPKSAAFLDTKGWVLLKMGRVEEARTVLKDAVDLCKKSEDSCYVIERHLKIAVGDVR